MINRVVLKYIINGVTIFMSHSQDGEIVEARCAVWNTEANAFRCVGLGMYASVISAFVSVVKPVSLNALLAPRLHRLRSM